MTQREMNDAGRVLSKLSFKSNTQKENATSLRMSLRDVHVLQLIGKKLRFAI